MENLFLLHIGIIKQHVELSNSDVQSIAPPQKNVLLNHSFHTSIRILINLAMPTAYFNSSSTI